MPNRTWELHSYNGPTAAIQYRLRVVCDPYYYGKACTLLCKPRNDKFGHFYCDERGKKICHDGWRGKVCDEGRLEWKNRYVD